MTTPPVVEKTVVDIELKSGHYESERAERADWTKKLSTVENLVLDDYGVLVKRGGLTALGTALDENSAFMGVFNHRLLPLQNGIANVGNAFRLYHFDESAQVWRKKNRVPCFGVESHVVATNGATGGATYSGALMGVALTDRYRAVMYSVSTSSTVNHLRIGIQDRESGLVVRDLLVYLSSGTRTVGAMTAVDNRYIHFVFGNTSSTRHGVIDTLALPANSAAMTVSTVASLGGIEETIIALLPGTNHSVLVRVQVGGIAQLTKYNNAGTLVLTSTATAGAQAADINYSTEDIYTIDGANLSVWGFATLTQVTRTLTGLPGTITEVRIAVDDAGECRIIAEEQTETTGSAENLPQWSVFSLAAAATACTDLGPLVGWGEACAPFYNPESERFYIGLVKIRGSQNGSTYSAETVGACVLADITEPRLTTGNGRFPVAAVLEPYLATTADVDTSDSGSNAPGFRRSVPQLRASRYGVTTCLGVSSLTASTARAYSAVELSAFDSSCVHSAPPLIGGGALAVYDGNEVAENGFVDSPSVFHTQVAGALSAGLRNYVAVYEFQDANGNLHYSRVSGVSSATNTGAQLNRIRVSVPSVSTHHGNESGFETSRVFCKLYRTTSGGQTYYLVTSMADPSAGFYSYDDSISDATLITRQQLFRQPGLQNAALDRYHAPSSRHIVQHKDRWFVCRGSSVYYSSFAVDGEAPWFNPAFTFSVPGGTGNITGLASMDGILVVFKRDGIWLVDGDGPPENGGSGLEFSPPRRILTEYGCVNPKSIVATPDGIMYRSSRGFELLTRGFSVAEPWVGEAVKDTADTYPQTGGACFDRNGGRALFAIGATYSYAGQVNPNGAGVILAYDCAVRAWSVLKATNGLGVYGMGIQDVAFSKIAVSGEPADALLVLDGHYYVYREELDNCLDIDGANYYVPFKIETAWIRAQSLQDRIRVSDFLFLGKKKSNHNLKISVAYDYSDTYSYTKTWTPADYSTVEQLELQIPRQAVQAVRFKIEDAPPDNTTTYPLGNGKGPEILCLSVKLGLRGGGAKLPAGQKG